MNFDGKVIIITGAGSGIGAETAKHFARLNASVVLVDKNSDSLSLTYRDCHTPSVKPLVIRADLAQDADVSMVVQKTIDHFGRLDILANIAGIYEVSEFQNSSMEQFDRIHSVNIRALYHLTLVCTPHLIASKGVIVNVSSAVTSKILPYVVAYSLAKVAVDHLTKSLAVELASKGVRVNAVNPGLTDTPIFDVLGTDRECYLANKVANEIPLGRIGVTSDIAKAVAFLASDDASYITGVTLKVDGAVSLC